ncbi:MAG: 50S ribosomal protein L17 [Chitinivibrionia bacterium]|nr:50S ribosomal protein L17 [Chitinivibrionia bacterium]
MRHRVDHRKLNRTSSHKKAMLNNMVTSLFDKERITTTDAKAKEARRFAERLITRAKRGYTAHKDVQTMKAAGNEPEAVRLQGVALAHWRHAARFVQKKTVLKKLFNDLAPLYIDRNGGYTRILKLAVRQGDSARTVMLELVGTEITSKPKERKPRKKKVEEETRADAGAATEPAHEAQARTDAEAADESTESKAAENEKDETK